MPSGFAGSIALSPDPTVPGWLPPAQARRGRRRGSGCASSPQITGLDDVLGDVAQLAVGALAGLAQPLEGLVLRDAVLRHEDADGRSDEPAVLQRHAQV